MIVAKPGKLWLDYGKRIASEEWANKMELHDSVFRNAEGEKKVAQLVKLFIDCGGHRMQLNSVNRERLTDAQKHPEQSLI